MKGVADRNHEFSQFYIPFKNFLIYRCYIREHYYEIQPLQNDISYIGALVGRVANRIAGAQFTLDGTVYKLVANEKKNTLHGTFSIKILKLELSSLS